MSRDFRAKKCCCKDLPRQVAFHRVTSEELISMDGSKCIRVMAMICDAHIMELRSSIDFNMLSVVTSSVVSCVREFSLLSLFVVVVVVVVFLSRNSI